MFILFTLSEIPRNRLKFRTLTRNNKNKFVYICKLIFNCLTFGEKTMQKIKLAETIEGLNLDKREVAETLFPGNKFPKMALDRVLNGETVLNADQISRLALFANVPLSSLFTGEGWGCKSRGKVHTFTNGHFVAKVDMETGKVDMFHKETIFHTENLISNSIELTELIDFLNKQILNYEAKN